MTPSNPGALAAQRTGQLTEIDCGRRPGSKALWTASTGPMA